MEDPKSSSSLPKKSKGKKPSNKASAPAQTLISMGDDGYDHTQAPSLDQKVRIVPGKGEFERYYTKGRELGLGAFSNVFLGVHKATKTEFAIKKIDRSKMVWGDSRDALEDEVNNLITVSARDLRRLDTCPFHGQQLVSKAEINSTTPFLYATTNPGSTRAQHRAVV
jgi:serine/threonine protein kinase